LINLSEELGNVSKACLEFNVHDSLGLPPQMAEELLLALKNMPIIANG